MIVRHLEKQRCHFEIWYLMLASSSWMKIVSGSGDGEEAAELTWKRRDPKQHSTYRYDPILPYGCKTWREAFLRYLKSHCYKCSSGSVYMQAYRKRPNLASRKWLKICFRCSGDTEEMYLREKRICGKCKERTFAYQCRYDRCGDCCSGCDRHPRKGGGHSSDSDDDEYSHSYGRWWY